MAQQIIIEYLEKVKVPKSRGQIASDLGIAPISVSHALKSLVKYKEVKYKEITRQEAYKNYKCYRRMCIYYV